MKIPPNLTPEQKCDFYASLTKEEYHATLSRCCVGVGVILFNSQGQILVVKPNYREGWLLTGGTIDEGESPAQTAIRETLEEVGITLPSVTFLYVEHALRTGVPDFLEFVFSGGVLTDEQIAGIKLETAELDEYAFVDPEKAIEMLKGGSSRRLRVALEALKNNMPIYGESSR